MASEPGYAFVLEKKMKKFLPGCEIRAEPHISSKMHVWKKTCASLALLKSNNSGMGWDDITKSFSCEDEKWASWLKVDPNAKGLRNKSFPHLDDWYEIFGKDRASGTDAQSFGDATQDVQQDTSYEADNDITLQPTQRTTGNGSPVNDVGQSSGTASESTSRRGGRTKGTKRRSTNLMEERFIDVMETFSQNTDGRLAEIAARMANKSGTGSDDRSK